MAQTGGGDDVVCKHLPGTRRRSRTRAALLRAITPTDDQAFFSLPCGEQGTHPTKILHIVAVVILILYLNPYQIERLQICKLDYVRLQRPTARTRNQRT